MIFFLYMRTVDFKFRILGVLDYGQLVRTSLFYHHSQEGLASTDLQYTEGFKEAFRSDQIEQG